jgi:hypothetical protein
MFKICLVHLLCLAAACCAYSQENNSFAEQQVYSTDAFRFDVPKPWFYAIPDATKTKNVARCFLHSRLRASAQGLFLVDIGQAAESLDKTIDGMTKVMKGANTAEEVQREDVVLDGDKAVHLKSATANYALPCSVIIDDHNGTLYLIMMSVSKKGDLENRDLMVKSLLRTWKWKDSKDSKSHK